MDSNNDKSRYCLNGYILFRLQNTVLWQATMKNIRGIIMNYSMSNVYGYN